MSIHIEIHIGSRRPAHRRSARYRQAALTASYNVKSRHPMQAFTRPQPAAGSVHFGAPLALVALLAGLSSYAIAGRPVDLPDFQIVKAQAIEQALNEQELAALEPAAGPDIELAQAGAAPQPQSIANQPVLSEQARETAEELRVEPLSIEDLEPFLEARAVPIPPRPVSARGNPASRVVSVTKNAQAASYEAKMVAADRALESGQVEAAGALYTNLQERDGKDPRALMGLAVSHQKAGRSEEAIALYEEILRRDPDHLQATLNVLSLLKDTRPEEVYKKLSTLWGDNANNPDVAAQLALSSARLGDMHKAFQYMGVAIALDPENAGHVYNLAVLTDKQGAHVQAMNFYKKALEVDAIYGGGKSIPRDLVYDRIFFLRTL